jgi:hypothetical protein
MQAAHVVTAAFARVLHFLDLHWAGTVITALAFVAALSLEIWWLLTRRPRDLTGNGIAIGQAKAFDSSSLTLRLQRLNAGLEALKVVNQDVTENLSSIQERTSTESSASLSLASKEGSSKGVDGKNVSDSNGNSGSGAKEVPTAGAKTSIGLGAGDALTNQLNLASQIFNLQTLYEGSLSDRMIADESRLQTVLGFQVSISPPAGYEDCVAVVEMAVRTKATPAAPPAAAVPAQAVSLVALMPQEKTYNAESTTSAERSVGGTAAVKVFTVGLGQRRASSGVFIRRDPETVAFERKASETPKLLEDATTFGWEFRPELGRRAVSPGPRQLMAVIALPVEDLTVPAETTLEIMTRSYWRRYDRKRQISALALSWWPWRVDRSGVSTSAAAQELAIPNTAKIQNTLAASVKEIDWSDIGGDKTYVKVTGRNFFPGTKVLIGGESKQETDGTLNLKSEQVLEFEAPLEALVVGDGVVIGRYGKSVGLEDTRARPIHSLNIWSASIRPMRNAKVLRLTVDILGQDENGIPQPFTVANLEDLPDPILCVGNETVPGPYDFSNPAPPPSGAPAMVLRVEAWISASSLAKSREVSFRVPFCGLDYYINQPIAYSEPSVTRMGSDATSVVFRIYFPQVFATQSDVTVDLDKTYSSQPELVAMGTTTSGASEYRFTVSNELVSRYQNIVVRAGKGEPYVIPIPQEEKPPPRAAIDTSTAPAKIDKGKHGPVEWQGTALHTIRAITFTPPAKTAETKDTPSSVPQDFVTYSEGTRLVVYLSDVVTAQVGRIVLDCTTASGAGLKIPLFVLEA